MTVSAPWWTAQRSFASSHSASLEMGELPRFALIFVRVATSDSNRRKVLLQMVSVGRNDEPSASNFISDGLRGSKIQPRRRVPFSGVTTPARACSICVAKKIGSLLLALCPSLFARSLGHAAR